jgi:menaquinone-dependent protoporphyrinogen oxidase
VHEPKILVAYHSSEGQTAKVAQRIADVLREKGADVDVREAESAPAPDGYDGAVLGDSIHIGHHSRALSHYLSEFADALDAMPSALFQVSLTSADHDDEHDSRAHELVQGILDKTGFDPDIVGLFAGALRYTRYGWFKRHLMHAIAKRDGHETDPSHDYEYTDWAAVDHFAEDVFSMVAARMESEAAGES